MVTPPISIPVSSLVCTASAKLTFLTPKRCLTSPFTSSLVVASTRQAAKWPSGRREATRMVLADRSSGTPYASQKRAVSAKSGSQSISSKATPSVCIDSRTAASIGIVGEARSGPVKGRSIRGESEPGKQPQWACS